MGRLSSADRLNSRYHVTRIDEEQLRQLVKRHGAALVLYARQWCSVPDDALQEALIELVRQQPVPNHPVAWLYTTVRRRAMNLARSDHRRQKHHRLCAKQRETWFLPPEEAWEGTVDLETMLQRLPAVEREIVVARIWGELSFTQISQLVDRSISSVHRQYQRALKKLQQIANEKPNSVESSHESESTPS